MKKQTLFRMIFLNLVLVWMTACTNNSTYFNSPNNQNLLRESWLSQVNTRTQSWTQGADRWFFTGEPNDTEQYALKASNNNAMSITAVKVSQFTHVHVDGCFQLQLTSNQAQNSVFILGPNQAVRQVSVQASGNTIYISQFKDKNGNRINLKNVIVRVGVRNLRHLTLSGNLAVEGRQLASDGLVIETNNAGPTLLAGRLNLLKINHFGSGTTSILGVSSPCLDITTVGNGNLNLSGHMNVRFLYHQGNGNVNLVGIDSAGLSVSASGNGLTSAAGYINLKKIIATQNSQVYLYWITSYSATILQRDGSHIGLAGSIANLDITLSEQARFDGQYLHGQNIYVRTQKNAHANIAADRKIFASAIDNSSIYFYGSPTIVSRYTRGSGSVIPMWTGSNNLPVPAMRPVVWGKE